MSNTQASSSHGKLIAVVVAAALVVVLALLSAFVWPGWALNTSENASNNGSSTSTGQQSSKTDEEPTTPSIEATALPDDATALLKAMPDSVLNYARTAAEPSTTWQAASPLEEYTVTYSTGKKAKDVTLIIAQWSTSDSAKTQYDALVGAMTGKTLGSGNVKVSGETTGSYTVKANANDDSKATAVWQNDTAVFQASGAKDAVNRFYLQFPL